MSKTKIPQIPPELPRPGKEPPEIRPDPPKEPLAPDRGPEINPEVPPEEPEPKWESLEPSPRFLKKPRNVYVFSGHGVLPAISAKGYSF